MFHVELTRGLMLSSFETSPWLFYENSDVIHVNGLTNQAVVVGFSNLMLED